MTRIAYSSPRQYVRGATIAALLALLLSVAAPAVALADTERDTVGITSSGSFSCELPRWSGVTTCQVGVRKLSTQILEVTHISSGADRQVETRARDANGNAGGWHNTSPGQTRILVNQGPSSTYSIEARTRYWFASRTAFNGSWRVR
jgi:hypothetical protein